MMATLVTMHLIRRLMQGGLKWKAVEFVLILSKIRTSGLAGITFRESNSMTIKLRLSTQHGHNNRCMAPKDGMAFCLSKGVRTSEILGLEIPK